MKAAKTKKPETIKIDFIRPRLKIGQEVHVPLRDRTCKTIVLGYNARIIKDNRSLLGVVQTYVLQNYVSIRNGSESEFTSFVHPHYIYANPRDAKKASRFLPVKAASKEWKLAVGDREVKDESSPYYIDNCGLPACCANISEARDILIYCQAEGGLIVHERDILRALLEGHDMDYPGGKDNLSKILSQLEIGGKR